MKPTYLPNFKVQINNNKRRRSYLKRQVSWLNMTWFKKKKKKPFGLVNAHMNTSCNDKVKPQDGRLYSKNKWLMKRLSEEKIVLTWENICNICIIFPCPQKKCELHAEYSDKKERDFFFALLLQQSHIFKICG